MSQPARKTILVVEDDVFIRLTIAGDLMDHGFHVIQAASADEALQLLHSSVQVDLVTTDIHMPGSMDGLALARRLRVLRPALKIIVLSSDAEAGRTAAAGDIFVDKPYSAPDLLGRIHQLLGDSHD